MEVQGRSCLEGLPSFHKLISYSLLREENFIKGLGKELLDSPVV